MRPATYNLAKGFFLLTALESVPGNCIGLERRMRRIASLFLMNAGCFSCFGKRKCEKRPIIDENVRNMPQEAKPVLAFTWFYTYRMGLWEHLGPVTNVDFRFFFWE